MGALFIAWMMTAVLAYYFHSKLKPLEALANWERDLSHDPCYRSKHLEEWHTNLLSGLVRMRRNQWVSKDEFRTLRKKLSGRYDLIKSNASACTSRSRISTEDRPSDASGNISQ